MAIKSAAIRFPFFVGADEPADFESLQKTLEDLTGKEIEYKIIIDNTDEECVADLDLSSPGGTFHYGVFWLGEYDAHIKAQVKTFTYKFLNSES